MSAGVKDPNIDAELREAYKLAMGKDMPARNDGQGECEFVIGLLLMISDPIHVTRLYSFSLSFVLVPSSLFIS